MEVQKITVRGYALDEKKVLKAIKRAGKAAEPWPFPGYAHFASFYKYPSYIVNHYYDTYGATNGAHTFFHTPAVYSVAVASDEAVASLFSDDNPHACTIMWFDHAFVLIHCFFFMCSYAFWSRICRVRYLTYKFLLYYEQWNLIIIFIFDSVIALIC